MSYLILVTCLFCIIGFWYVLLLIISVCIHTQNATSVHDAVSVPFTLPAEAQNEGQFAFSVKSISMSQKLKGTLSYIVKVCIALNSCV